MREMYFSNAVNFEDAGADPYLVSAWFTAGINNRTGANPLGAGTPFPANTMLKLAATGAPDLFFEPTNYIGAFRSVDDNWAAGWTYDFR
jgi:hypothetical protein